MSKRKFDEIDFMVPAREARARRVWDRRPSGVGRGGAPVQLHGAAANVQPIIELYKFIEYVLS